MLSSEFREKIFGICCFVLITTVIVLVFPNGKMKETIKTYFSIIVIFVLLSTFDLNGVNKSKDVYYNNTLESDVVFDNILLNREEYCKNLIKNELQAIGLECTSINLEYYENSYEIKKISIFISNENNEEIKSKKKSLIESISNKLCIDKENIVFYDK